MGLKRECSSQAGKKSNHKFPGKMGLFNDFDLMLLQELTNTWKNIWFYILRNLNFCFCMLARPVGDIYSCYKLRFRVSGFTSLFNNEYHGATTTMKIYLTHGKNVLPKPHIRRWGQPNGVWVQFPCVPGRGQIIDSLIDSHNL